MEDIAGQLALRDSFRGKLAKLKTHEERMADLERLQERSRAILLANPQAYAWFLRRNFKARSIDASPFL